MQDRTRLARGGRAPAPGRLWTVQEFLNTGLAGADVLAHRDALAAWLVEHDLPAGAPNTTASSRAQLLEFREVLRAWRAPRHDVERGSVVSSVNVEIARLGVRPRVSRNGCDVQFTSKASPSALSVIVEIVLTAIVEGDWSRLKVCADGHCGRAFWDSSKNQSARWCDAVCLNRAKARAYERRRRMAVQRSV